MNICTLACGHLHACSVITVHTIRMLFGCLSRRWHNKSLMYSECKLSGSTYVAHTVVLWWLYTELREDITILQLRHGIFCANLVPFLWPSHIIKCLIVQNFDKPDGMAGKVVSPSFLL